jgi:hypothetical protein
MRMLSGRLREPDMSEEPMPRKRYVSLSALSGIFCRVGRVLPSSPTVQNHSAMPRSLTPILSAW